MQFVRRIFCLTLISLSMLFIVACSTAPEAPPEPTVIQVKLSEFAIDPSEITVPPGIVTLDIENAGFVEHNIIIKELDQGVDFVYPEQTYSFSADLAPGTYTLVCTVEGHEAAGMVGTLTVAE